MSATAAVPPPPKTAAGEDSDTSHIPYVSPVAPTPATTTGLPTISTLPPIATARPQPPPPAHGPHYPQGNIPIVNGVRQNVTATQPHYAPTVVNLSAAPSAAAPHMLPDMVPPPPFFEYMDKCRYAAGFMLCYYICTFLFLQPFFLGILGILTGFLGYYGSRPPIFAAHIKWIRGYLWMNMSLLVMNVWYAAIVVFFLTATRKDDDSDVNVGGGDVGSNYYTGDEQHLGLFIGIVIGLNLVLHVRGVRTARCFYAEMLRAGPLPGQRTVIVMGGNAV